MLAAFAVGAVKLQSEGSRSPWGTLPPPKVQDPYGQNPEQVKRMADSRPQHNGQLIVKYKTAARPAGVATTNSAALSIDLAHAQVASTARFATGGVSLTYARSITNRLHVIKTAGMGTSGKAATLADMQALAAQLAQDPQVEYAEVDRLYYPTTTKPNDTRYATNQWHYHAPGGANMGGANLPLAWDIGTGTGAVVAVVDTGITSHSDLNANVLPGYDFISGDNYSIYGLTDNYTAKDGGGWDADPSDPGDGITSSEATTICTALGTPTTVCANDYTSNSSWHGTHVAGTIAAVSNNSQGVAGVAYGAKILPVRVLGRLGGATSDIAAGIRWAAGLAVSGVPSNANPARVINMSLGGSGACGPTYQSAIDDARTAGAVVVVATGNDGNITIGSPANCTGVLAVTAHTYDGDSAGYANVGTGTSISAPGGGYGSYVQGSGKYIDSTINMGLMDVGSEGYTGYQGTSMATPHVAGVVALLLGNYPSMTEAQVRSVITGNVRAFPSTSFCYSRSDCGSGLLDANLALRAAAVAYAPPSATASASVSQVDTATEQVITLSVLASAPMTNGTLTYQWSQVGNTPSVVSLSTPTASTTTFTKPAGKHGTYSFQVVVTDMSNSKTTTKTVSVTSNTPPVLADVADMSATVGQALSFTLTGTDADSDALTYSDVSTATPAPMVTANTGAVSWTPTQPGTYTLSFKANDGLSDSGAKSTTVTVTSASGGGSGGGGGCTVGSIDQRDGSLLLLSMAALLAMGWRARKRHQTGA